MNNRAIIRKLEITLDEARRNLVQSTGGESVCSIHKHGHPSDSLKYNEGKEFVVRKVIGLLNKGVSEMEILAFLAEHSRKFNRYKSSQSIASPAWRAYADGGLDAIELIKREFKDS